MYNKSEANKVYFRKVRKTKIDDVSEGEIIHIQVRSPLKYGNKVLNYYGKLVKKTKYYFDILNYYINIPFKGLASCTTADIEICEKNQKRYVKRWAKKSVIEVYLVEI